MPFLWPPIEEEKYFPRKPENVHPNSGRLGRVPTIFNHLSCAHILPLPYTFICAHKWIYFLFCCVAVVGGRFENFACVRSYIYIFSFLSLSHPNLYSVRILFDFTHLLLLLLETSFYRHSRFPGFLSVATIFESSSPHPLLCTSVEIIIAFVYFSLTKRESQKVVGGNWWLNSLPVLRSKLNKPSWYWEKFYFKNLFL